MREFMDELQGLMFGTFSIEKALFAAAEAGEDVDYLETKFEEMTAKIRKISILAEDLSYSELRTGSKLAGVVLEVYKIQGEILGELKQIVGGKQI